MNSAKALSAAGSWPEREVNIAKQGGSPLGPLGGQTAKRFHKGLQNIESFVCVAILPKLNRILIFLGRSLAYRGNLIHGDASLGWADLEFKLAIGDAEDLSLTTLSVFLDNKILGGKHAEGSPKGHQS